MKNALMMQNAGRRKTLQCVTERKGENGASDRLSRQLHA